MRIFILILTLKPPQAAQLIVDIAPTIDLSEACRVLLLSQNAETNSECRVGWTTVYECQDNLGCAGGRQFLVNRACELGLDDGDVLCFLDDDLSVQSDTWLADLIDPIATGKADICGVAGRIIDEDFWTRECPEGREPDYVSGGWCAVAGRIFLSGVRFDTRFHPCYYEDVDICFTARRAGFRIAQCERSGLHHEPHDGNPEWIIANRERFREKWGVRV